MGDDRVEDVVHRLVALCRESEAAYRSAAERLVDLHGQALFMEIAQQRSLSAAALASLVESGGAKPAGQNAPAGGPPRPGAMPQAFVASNDAAILVGHLREVEERTLDELGKVLAQDLPMDVRTAVDQQYRAVRRAYGRLVTFPSAVGS